MSGWIKNPKDLGTGLLFTALGLLAFYVARGYNFGTSRTMGPGYFPSLLSGALMLIGLVLTGRAFFVGADKLDVRSIRPLAVVLLACVAFAVLMQRAGLLIALLALVLLGSKADPTITWKLAVVLAASLAVGSWLVFAVLLGQPLPLFGTWLAK